MAQFEGVQWAESQLRYFLKDKKIDYVKPNSRIFAVSRSIHYGLFLAFEGIRFFCKHNAQGELEILFVNWLNNLDRFRRGIAFNLGDSQHDLVPTKDELVQIFLDFFRQPQLRSFLENMASSKAQGYLRPFTVDEDQSIGVTFPDKPSVRAVACRYDRYLGEPFSGVVIPNMVRAIGTNGTGCLKLGVNYLISIKAVDRAKQLLPGAASALFLDDNPWQDLMNRTVTEWDSSCCLIALTDGSVIKIPESNLILPSVTIQGVVRILSHNKIKVVERDITYGELTDRAKADEIVAVCSIGTAGILNRCSELMMVDRDDRIMVNHKAKKDHDMFRFLGKVKALYWNIYQEEEPPPEGMKIYKYTI